MSNKCVTVLAPNGRRQNVKVTPNTTILQILEEVCVKQGFKAEEYDIRHHNKVLDVSSIMRYTGLPNNAQLEMADTLKTRAETRVKVALALESGNRVMGEFEPSDSLWHVVKTLCPNDSEADESSGILPVIFYVGREECGKENLQRVTLRSLGLTSGGGILRFFKKSPEELHRQANVSAPLSRPISTLDPVIRPSSSQNNVQKATSLTVVNDVKPRAQHSSNIEKESEPMQLESKDTVSFPQPDAQGTNDERTGNISCTMLSSEREKSQSKEDLDMDFESSSQATQSSSVQSLLTTSNHPENVSQEPVFSAEPEETIVFLGERNAILFDVATARACQPDDVPDDFFDLTLDDAKQLLRDLKRRQAALEEQPLVTSQYRELEKSKQMLNALSQYKRCIIKVQFPNQLVLQGTFKPLEKVSHILEFVRKYLQDPAIDFDIFTAPPKQILLAEQSLYDANCVPGVLVHFTSSTPCPNNGSYIHENIMFKVSSVSAAACAASSASKIKNPSLKREAGPSNLSFPSKANNSNPPNTSAGPSENSGEMKVPKWFQSNKK